MRLESQRLCAVDPGQPRLSRGLVGSSLAALLVLAGGLLFAPAGMAQQALCFDFDDTGPTQDDELPDFFEVYGFDNFFGPEPDPGWHIDQNYRQP